MMTTAVGSAPVGEQDATMPADEIRLSLTSVTKAFGPVVALDEVTLDVSAGRVHGLIGENGAGKSTLMAVASGVLVPDAGKVLVNGRDVRGDAAGARAAGLAIVRQHPALLPQLTIADNILLAVPPHQRPKIQDSVAWARACLDAWDDRPDIDPRMRADTLNAEQQFIVELARAVAQQPSVLLLDEPSEHLRAADVDRLFSVVRRLAASGTAVVYISHRIREVREIAEEVTVLRNGISRGTYITAELDEQRIIELIIGRSLEQQYPDKIDHTAEFAMHPPVLEARRLSGDGFRDASLTIRPGEIVGLAGIDGNGQQELARALAGLTRYTGYTNVDGKGVHLLSPSAAVASGVAYVPADRHREGVFPDLSVRENAVIRGIARVARFGFVNAARERAEGMAVLNRYAVKTASPDAPITSLSGGNQQKVVIGGALISSPRLLIADQPTQGVDVGAKAEIYQQLREVAATGSGVLMLSSDNSELAGVCDRVVVMSRGQIIDELVGDAVQESGITAAVLRASTSHAYTASPPKRWRRIVDSDLAPVPVMLALIVALAIIAEAVSHRYFGFQNISLVLALSGILALAATAQSLVIMHGGIDLSIGPVIAFAPIIASYYVIGAGFAFDLQGWVFIILLALAVGTVNWLLASFLRINPMLLSFGMWSLLDAVALVMRPLPGGIIDHTVVDALSSSVGPIPIAIVVAIAVVAGMEIWRTRTIAGKSTLALGSSPAAAATLGLRRRRIILRVMLMSALLATAAGVLLIGQTGTGDPTAGTPYVLNSVAAAAVAGVALTGGRGSFWSVLVASVLLVQVQTVTPYLGLSFAWQNILVAGATIGAVCVYAVARRRRA
jgi:ribose transport system ATP-binding protein